MSYAKGKERQAPPNMAYKVMKTILKNYFCQARPTELRLWCRLLDKTSGGWKAVQYLHNCKKGIEKLLKDI